jgi:hypothetical protein
MAGQRTKAYWKTSAAHLLLLSKFRYGGLPKHYTDAQHWQSALGEEPAKAIEKFLEERLLVKAGLNELLDFQFKTSDLKRMLKERHLKVSGRKSELIERLIVNDKERMAELTKDIGLLKCTTEGAELAENYVTQEREKRERAGNEVLSFLKKHEFSKAVRVVVDFERSQVFPRGLGINWNTYSGESDIEALRAIFGGKPGILKDIDEGCLDSLRLGAAMMQLWGTNSARPWLPEDFETGSHLDADAAARMFVFHTSHLRNMDQYKKAGVKTVEVLGAGDDNTCPACQEISGKKYKLDKVPELPNPNCTCEIGCRCTTVVGDF